jgi:murein DD-endopeptidase MepM/ murein hydrolase activator NlpD
MSWRTLFLILLVLPSWGAVEDGSQLDISHRARSLQPGEAVLIRAQSAVPLSSMQVKAFGKKFLFYPAEEGRVWQGLIGIDLETTPDDYSLSLTGSTVAGLPVEATYPLRVLDKEFPTRRLTVEEKFVNPPQEELERIRRESKRVREIFAALNPEKIWHSSFQSPVPGAPTSGFGKRSILNGQPRSPHTGTDFDADEGTPVNSPNTGKVILVSPLYYSGNTVILDHGQGLYSYFAHLSRFGVAEGDLVSPGEVIGHVGATGRVTGPHLHWTVRLNGSRIDPLSLIAVLSDENAQE